MAAKPLFETNAVHSATLPELIPVVPKATVSKPLIDTGLLKQVLFSMDIDQEISEHKAPFVATVHVLDGCLQFTVAGKEYLMCAGAWLLMPPNEPHSLVATMPTRFLLTLIKDRQP